MTTPPEIQVCSSARRYSAASCYQTKMTRTKIEPTRFVQNGDVTIAVYQWGEDRVERPKLLLLHGTGFCAGVWQSVAQSLANDFVVYAIDRRGHGLSGKPDDAYHFSDFREDLIAVIDALGLVGAYGVGHSAGATDLLLASVDRPQAFRRLFTMEPTVMDPSARRESALLSSERLAALAQTGRRRSHFSSFEEVFERYRSRATFLAWRPELLDLYVRHGFSETVAGVELRCRPSIERAMLIHIYAVMENFYGGDARGNPFEDLARIKPGSCCVSTAEKSGEMYKRMANIATSLILDSRLVEFADAGHCVAQERPEEVARALREFWEI